MSYSENNSRLARAQRELLSLPEGERLAVLNALEEKRKEQAYVRYWTPVTEDQWRGVKLLAQPDTKIALICGGNRSGKTETGAAVVVAYFLGKKAFEGETAWEWVQDLPIPERPRNIWVVGLDFNMLRDVIWREKLRIGKGKGGFLPKEGVLNVKKINDGDFQVFGEDGSVITGKSADSGREKFQGASIDLVWLDEECEVEIFEECYQRTVDCAGKILVTVTPLADITSAVRKPWIYDLVSERRAGRKDVGHVELSVLDNPFVPAIEKEKLLQQWAGHPEEQARLYGKFVQRAGLVYNLFDRKKHLIPRVSLPAFWRRVACIDPAPSGPTACLWAAIAPNGDMYIYREYKEANLVVGDHARNIQVRNAGDAIDIWFIDPKGGNQKNAETHRTTAQLYKAAGIPVRFAVLAEDYGLNASREYIANTITPNAPGNKVYIMDDLILFPQELGTYTWDFYARGEMKGMSKEKPRKGNDDLINCFQYLSAQRLRGRVLGATSTLEGQPSRKFSELNSYS